MANQNKDEFLSPSFLKEGLKNHLKVPVVFKNQLKCWSLIPQTLNDMAEKYGNVMLDFRLVPRKFEGIAWEGAAEYIEAALSQFVSWQTTDEVDVSNPFHQFHKDDFWAYSSYNYLSDIFDANSDLLKVVDWSIFGFSEAFEKDSAFWVGSKGASTPCHFDSYGFNLVVQIHGRKKWVLFPPEDTPFLYPTRIPYEESSVFSSVNILNPDLIAHPLFMKSHPHIAILEPGDILFVPKKWWHFVSSLDTTISINTWLNLDSDSESHLEESVSRALMSSFISYYEPEGKTWLNPKEELVQPEDILKYISLALNESKPPVNESHAFQDELQCNKSMKTSKESDIHSKYPINKILTHKYVQHILPIPFSELLGQDIQEFSAGSVMPLEISVKNIIDCFVHPEVVSTICQILKRNLLQ